MQERYKDDREKLGARMMELYKREKVNPVAGCMPMLIQIPVFLAFYWVLLESVEMRQAPFFGWIQDLSSRDPFFILPLLMGAAMFAAVQAEPPPPDPVQAKVFMLHAADDDFHVRVVSGGPGAVLGDQHRAVDRPAVEHQPRGGGRSEETASELTTTRAPRSTDPALWVE